MSQYTEIHIPGPSREGFRVHILLTEERDVLLLFGFEITHIPMPPPIAWRLSQAILQKCYHAEPNSKLMVRCNQLFVMTDDRRVLLETRKPIEEITLSLPEARELVYRLCDTAARAVGRPLPPDFPLL